jgi:hypothetical protein
MAKAKSDTNAKANNGTGGLRERVEAELSTAKTENSELVFNRSDLLGSLRGMLGEQEWKKNFLMWAKRGREHKRALSNALEDFFVRTPEQRNEIKSPAAWLTDRYERCVEELKHNSRNDFAGPS